LGDIGEALRSRRNELGLSLEQVCEAIKIRPKYLKAIEDDDASCVPAEVYYRGFLRSYGNFLGLDGPSLVKRRIASLRPEPVRPKH
jgi:cytoskeletal protein RodZ